jgi:microcystin-dependent protein
MKKILNICLIMAILVAALMPITVKAQSASVCKENYVFLPIIAGGNMANPTIIESLEEVLQRQREETSDAIVVELFPESITAKIVSSDEVVTGIAIPAHIDKTKIVRGQAIRLGMHQGQRILLAVLDNYDEDANYSGLGYPIPHPPNVIVAAKVDGWHVSWSAAANAVGYRLYRNDDPDETTPDEVGDFAVNIRETIVPFEGTYIWFAVKSLGVTTDSEVSNWCTDANPPVNPSWVSHEFQAGGHLLKWRHVDINDVKEFVLWRNTSGVDAGAVEVARTRDLSCLATYNSDGDWFGIQAVDYADNESAIVWTAQAYDPTPNPPTGATGVVTSAGFVISWVAPVSNNPPVAGYRVYSDDNAGGTSKTLRWSGNTTTSAAIAYTGDEYFFVCSVGYDTTESTFAATGQIDPTPNQPNDVLVSVLNTQFLAIWGVPSTGQPVKEYVVYSDDNSNGTSKTEQWRGMALKTSYLPYTGDNFFWIASVGYDNSESPHVATGYIDQKFDTFQDKFDMYGGDNLSQLDLLSWLKIADFEDNETWNGSNILSSNINKVEGDKSLRMLSMDGIQNATKDYSTSKNFDADGRFTDDDYVIASIYIDDISHLNWLSVRFITSDSNFFKINITNYQNGWNYVKVKKSDVVVEGAPDWSDINKITVYLVDYDYMAPFIYAYFDDWRVVKADPANANDYNDTGNSWDKAASTGTDKGEWHIYPGNRASEPSKPYSYGQIKIAASPAVWYLSHKPLATINILTGTVQTGLYIKDADGEGGLAFFVHDVAADSWDMYAIEADSAADTVKLVKWVAGTRAEIASASFIFAPNQILWLGVDIRDYDSDDGRIKVFASLSEGNLIQAANMVISTQDTSVGSGGSVGILSKQANLRSVNIIAGSPAHSDVADVAFALDGPIIAGETRRVVYNRDTNIFEYTEDGVTFLPVVVPAASESASGIIELATQTEVNTGTDAVRAVTPATMRGSASSETMPGVIELATQAEVNTGTDAVRAVTPATLKATPSSRFIGESILWRGKNLPTFCLWENGAAVSRTTYAALYAVLCPSLGTFTVTKASPGVFTLTAHGLSIGDRIRLSTTGALYTGLTANTDYYVLTVPSVDSFTVSASYNGSAVNTSGSQSGVHSAQFFGYGAGDGSTTFNLPDSRGRSLLGKDDMGGTAANRVTATNADNLGNGSGAETHTLQTTEIPAHSHPIYRSTSVYIAAGSAIGVEGSANGGETNYGETTKNAGGGGAHNNMSPYGTVNFIIYAGV